MPISAETLGVLFAIVVQILVVVWGASHIATEVKELRSAFEKHEVLDEKRFTTLDEKANDNAVNIAKIGGRLSGAVVGQLTPHHDVQGG